MTDRDELGDQVAQHDLRMAAARYEEVRTWTPSLFCDVWDRCMNESLHFDDVVDGIITRKAKP